MIYVSVPTSRGWYSTKRQQPEQSFTKRDSGDQRLEKHGEDLYRPFGSSNWDAVATHIGGGTLVAISAVDAQRSYFGHLSCEMCSRDVLASKTRRVF